MAQVTMTMEEYLMLVNGLSGEGPQMVAEAKAASPNPKPKKVTPKQRKARKNLSKALEEANAKLRKDNGDLRKGKTQRDVMVLAQKLARNMK